ncbi:alpha/beta fold hydrolase [Roseivivax sp. THAF197b]|uniref:alpha/beta fold hydrolase n=1 Tax=Roseivivax sp. THAF197b TaxID=2588299 RepID=UPI0012695B8C|nr:alpha/beta fold hydrolase [Roseivivax sp. THAF197b]QFS83792.1 Pyrethroid hydrolase [Roseivivax sp. THAF197b]
MAHFLLVHGSCHGAWCWRDLIPALEAQGHTTRAIDLPSHGNDPTPPGDVTLDDYAAAIHDALDRPSIVVGHSMGGYPISRAADLDPTHIEKLVYLCAYVPRPGHSLIEMRLSAPRQPILKAVRKAEDGVTFSILPDHAREVFYHDCSDEQVAFALDHVCPQAVLPQDTKVTLGATYAKVPRAYIICEEDSAIPPEFQEEMAADFPAADVTRMATSHSPFFSDPAGLAAHLTRIAGT